MTSSSSSTKLSLKLLIDTTANKVLFAEASKEVIDLLFSLLEIPLGSVVKLLSSNETTAMNVAITNLYQSIQVLDTTYFQANKAKGTLLDPLSRRSSQMATLLLPARAAEHKSSVVAPNKKYYRCSSSNHNYDCCGRISNCLQYVCDVFGTTCPDCNRKMNEEMSFVNAAHNVAAESDNDDENIAIFGFVKGVVTYTVMDDLSVTPMSTISSITMLNRFNVKDVGALKEKTVELGFHEGLALLKASLQSRTVLTDVFMKNI